jgi:hypothetical protein
MTAHGDTAKRIWGTEWGFPSISASPHVIRERMTLSVRMWRTLPYTGPLFLYQWRDVCPDPADNECHFGIVTTDGHPKEPAYTALAGAWRYLRPVLAPGEFLTPADPPQVMSPDGRFQLFLQTDGNLVLYVNGVAIWATGTTDGALLANQTDGNLVLYRANGTAVWSTGTWNQAPSTLQVTDDGRLALAGWSTPAWEPAAGTLVRNDGWGIAVVAGGSALWFASPQELTDAGYAGVTPRRMSDAELGALLATPRDGTLVTASRQTLQVWRIAGGRRTLVHVAPGTRVITVGVSALNAIPV